MNYIKCVVVGDGMVGKTCLLVSFQYNAFPDYVPTTVTDNRKAHLIVDGESHDLDLWDTAGQEAYDRLRILSYPGTDIFLMCFSVDSRVSFGNIRSKWISEIRYNAPQAFIILVALKVDLREGQETNKKFVSHSEGMELCNEIGCCQYMECSAKTQEGLHDIFDEAVRCGLAAREAARKRRSWKCLVL